jgi:hypothetical protein
MNTTTEIETKEINVPTGNVKDFLKKIEKLNKKANTYGCKPIEILSISEKHTEKTSYPVFEGGEFMNTEEEASREVVTFTLTANTIKIGDYALVGVISWKDGVKVVCSEDETLFSRYENIEETRCDHCQSKRHRNTQIVFKNNITGEEVVIGSSCAKDYFGCSCQNYYKWFFEMQNLDEMDCLKGCWVKGWSLDRVLGCAIESIAQNGFRPTSDEHSTARDVLKMLMNGY